MKSDRFTVLQAEFETLSKRLKETQELAERQAILKEARRLITEMDALLQIRQTDLQKKLNKLRGGL